MSAIAALTEAQAERVQPGTAEFAQPMLATLTDEHFSDPGWIYERKLDGERCLAVAGEGR